ncbi:hypothetical protein U9M48_036761 [Paspalum notatum var. saurae]|uniref:Uncharacterized protein n=1 Tax=Paspalum notatum var. saurae TaxID=547442 RepID=A0AAQ3X9U8_PASNO
MYRIAAVSYRNDQSNGATDDLYFFSATTTSDCSLSFSPLTKSDSLFFANTSASNSPFLATASANSASKLSTLESISAFLAPRAFNSSTFAFTLPSISTRYASASFLNSCRLLSTSNFSHDAIRTASLASSNFTNNSPFRLNSSEFLPSSSATTDSKLKTFSDMAATSASFARTSSSDSARSAAASSSRASASALAPASLAASAWASRTDSCTAARRARSAATSSAAARSEGGLRHGALGRRQRGVVGGELVEARRERRHLAPPLRRLLEQHGVERLQLLRLPVPRLRRRRVLRGLRRRRHYLHGGVVAVAIGCGGGSGGGLLLGHHGGGRRPRGSFGSRNLRCFPCVFPGQASRGGLGPSPSRLAIWKPTRTGRPTRPRRFPHGTAPPTLGSGRLFPRVPPRARAPPPSSATLGRRLHRPAPLYHHFPGLHALAASSSFTFGRDTFPGLHAPLRRRTSSFALGSHRLPPPQSRPSFILHRQQDHLNLVSTVKKRLGQARSSRRSLQPARFHIPGKWGGKG